MAPSTDKIVQLVEAFEGQSLKVLGISGDDQDARARLRLALLDSLTNNQQRQRRNELAHRLMVDQIARRNEAAERE